MAQLRLAGTDLILYEIPVADMEKLLSDPRTKDFVGFPAYCDVHGRLYPSCSPEYKLEIRDGREHTY